MARDLGKVTAIASQGRDLGKVQINFGSSDTTPASAAPAAPTSDLVTDKGPLGNLAANVAGAGKKVFNFLTGSEQAIGGEIAAGLPSSITGEKKLNEANQALAASDINYIKTIKQRQAAGVPITKQQMDLYNHILETTSSVGTQTDLLPHAADTNVQALGNVAGVAADALGAGTYSKGALKGTSFALTKEAPTAVTATGKILDKAGSLTTKTAEQKMAQQSLKIADVVAPKQTAKEAASALATRGGTKTGFLRTIEAKPDPAVTRIAETVRDLVPDFSPKKSLVENINATKNVVSTLADNLKQAVIAGGKDRIYSFKELGSTLRALPKPTLLVGDSEKVYNRVVSKALEIARSNGGKVSDLLQARKEFDQFVEDQIPNLYNSDTQTAMRIAIRNVRRAITDFTAEHLPQEVGLHDALTKQSRLIEAVENMAEKAASGADKEVGTNALTRFAKKHPLITKFGIGGATVLGVDKVAKDTIGLGI